MKKIIILLLPLVLALPIFGACSRGEVCSTETFVEEFNACGKKMQIDSASVESYNNEHSFFFEKEKIMLTYFDKDNRVKRISVSALPETDKDAFADAIGRCCRVFALLNDEESAAVFEALAIGKGLTNGTMRFDSLRHRFSFGAEKFGCTFIIEDSALCPTTRLDVTTRVSAEK